MKICELDPAKICDDCGDCEYCELDASKKCDNCCKCIEDDADYAGITIDKIIIDETDTKKLLH